MEQSPDITFELFPNPSPGRLTISPTHNTQVTIIDVFGRIILENSLEAPQFEIDLSYQPPGVYVIKISANGLTESRRIIVSR